MLCIYDYVITLIMTELSGNEIAKAGRGAPSQAECGDAWRTNPGHVEVKGGVTRGRLSWKSGTLSGLDFWAVNDGG